MCIGVPVQVISPGQWFAKCRDRHGELIDVDIRLVAPPLAGAWLLTFGGAARREMDEAEAAEVLAAAVLFPQYHLEAGTFAIAGMGALMAASVRAPLTGIVLVLEMTDNYQLILPMIITCLGATLLAQFLGGKPLYSTILARTLAKQDAEQAAKNQNAPAGENT